MSKRSAEAFAAWCKFLLPTEGVLSLDPSDPGNWTSGQPGVGSLVGTKYGISAASHPTLDIANLTIEDANKLRKTEYWDQVRGDDVPEAVAIMLADAAYGSGPSTAIQQMQALLSVKADGMFGPLTMAALNSYCSQVSHFTLPSGVYDFVCEYATQRLQFEEATALWSRYKLGWTRRVTHDIALALTFAS